MLLRDSGKGIARETWLVEGDLPTTALATGLVNQAKNSWSRRGGFSPSQWVIGKDIRLPATFTDEDEVRRVGAIALAESAGTRFYTRFLRRAELRQVRPSGPFPFPSALCFLLRCFWGYEGSYMLARGGSSDWEGRYGCRIVASSSPCPRNTSAGPTMKKSIIGPSWATKRAC